MNTSLFDLLPPDILADIDICLSGLEHRNKFKHIILHFKYMSNPIIFAIRHEHWTPYYNFESFRWCNIVMHNWARRLILVGIKGYWIHYEYLTRKYEDITYLTPKLLWHRKSCISLNRLRRNEDSTIPYFVEKIPYYDEEYYIEHDVQKVSCPRLRWTCCPNITRITYLYFTITIFPNLRISPLPALYPVHVRQGFICTEYHNYNYLLLSYLLVLYYSWR